MIQVASRLARVPLYSFGVGLYTGICLLVGGLVVGQELLKYGHDNIS